jgi:K+-sensing histidine kinase KdpD
MRHPDATLRSRLLRYGFATLLVGVAVLLRFWLVPALGRAAPAAIVLVPTLLAARYRGVGPGLLVSFLSAAAAESWFVVPTGAARAPVSVILRGLAFASEGIAATALTVPLRNARLRAEAAARRMHAIYSLSAALGEAQTPDEVAHAILHQGVAALGADAGAIFLASGGPQGTLRLTSHIEPDPRMSMLIPLFTEFPIDSELPPAIAAQRMSVISASNADDVRAQFPALQDLLGQGLPPAFFCAPMIVGDRLVGVLAAAFAGAHPIDDDDRRWAHAMAQDCGTAMDRAHLLELEKQSRISAQTAGRDKDAFLVTVAGALRAPLPAILHGARVLREPGVDCSRHGAELDAIERSVRTALHLVESLLDLARIAAHELRMKTERVDLARLVRRCTDDLREGARAKGIHLVVAPRVQAGVVGDVGRLRQAISDLLENAIQFTPPGGHVRVEMESRDDRVLVRVKDDGVGIPAQELSHVFDAFHRSEAPGGAERLGIGLAIAKYVVDEHRGSIHVESPGEGRGTTGTLELPRAEAP